MFQLVFYLMLRNLARATVVVMEVIPANLYVIKECAHKCCMPALILLVS